MRFERFPIVLALLAMLCLVASPMFGQSLTTGNITGTVYDPSHAIVPGAAVNLKGLDTGSTASTTSNSSGSYSFSLLKPGRYELTVKQAGFAEVAETVEVEVGQTSKTDINLTVAKGTETVEVSAAAPLINTEASNNTAFTQEEVAQLPSAGGDITNIADTAPGVVVNGTMGYGNFTANGMPATSNLFTINGENDMDPYFNINNSGASNLTLGQNEIGEATVITNPYSGQYGQLAGAQISYVTKSGTNTFHGNAMYWWNGRLLNANDWMNIQGQEAAGQPNKPGFSNANQWATSIGGPIIKNKTFFFVDYEGMRFVLPNQDFVVAPTPQFAAAVAAQTLATNPAEAPTMNTLLGLWTNAPLYNTASTFAVTPGDSCDTLTAPGWVAGTPCSQGYSITPTALAWEYILSARVDQKLGSADNMFFRYKLDHGLQPTHIDPINSLFNANSLQPAWDSQLQETHVFGPTKTNQFTATLSHYVAQFIAANSVATFNYAQDFAEDLGIYDFSSPNAAAPDFPQGRNITQYQIIDDFSWTHGNHTFKFGENFRRYDVSDHNFFVNSPIVVWGTGLTGNLQGFANGTALEYIKYDNPHSDVPIAMWGMGGYAQDEWKATHNLKLTFTLRLEHNSNPVCQINCFANLTGPFANSAAVQAGTNGSLDVPYSADIAYNLHNAYPGVNSILFSPRVGFSWDPMNTGKTVISGGFGQFYDNPAAGMVDNLLSNPPESVPFSILGNPITAGVLPFTPTGAPATFTASAAAFNITESFNQINNALAPIGQSFSAPGAHGILGTIKSPEWQEWNLSVQQQLTRSLVGIITYNGNHGSRISYSNSWPNAWDGFAGTYAGNNGPPVTTGIFGGAIPLAPAAASYNEITEFSQGALSNYNGLTFSLRKQFTKWVSAHLNYTWSHNMDETSNGGLFNYGFEGNNSILGQISPVSLRTSNYGNTDYDIRHLLNGDFVFNPEFHKSGPLKYLVNGWQFSGKLFVRTGLPETITDGNLAGSVQYGGDAIPATVIGNAQPSGCGKANASYNGLGSDGLGNHGCLSAAGLLDTSVNVNTFNCFFSDPNPTVDCPNPTPLSAYSTQRRNQYRGPHYFDMDLNLFKNFKLGERFNMAIGAQAFNAFNHPNFALPNANFTSGDPTFGAIQSMQGVPTSPYGNFLGFDSSPRVMQVSAKIVF
jgi:hypothetical protein